MSNFSYGNIINHEQRFGVWINFELHNDILQHINKTKNKRIADVVQRVIVKEYDILNNCIWLEIWCKNLFDTLFHKHRYNVFYICLPPNPDWSCNGDLGTGYIN